MVMMRPDFRLPPSVKDEGPSAAAFFHGGDTGLGRRVAPLAGVEGDGSRVLRLLDGRASSGPSDSSAAPLLCAASAGSVSGPRVCLSLSLSGVTSGFGVSREIEKSSGDESGSSIASATCGGVWGGGGGPGGPGGGGRAAGAGPGGAGGG